MLEYILMAVPVIFLVGSVIYAYKSVTVRKHTRKRAVLSQLAAFAAVSVVCLVTAAITAFAAEGDPAAAANADPKAFGKALIFVALGEGVALYGLLVSILIISKV